MLTVPFGVVEVCQAGTSLTQPQSNLTVPPRLGSRTSTPSSPISLASSTIATTGAPVRLAIATVSPKWSPWPWVSRIVVAATSSARDRRLRVAGQERVDQDRRVAVGEREAGVAEKADFHRLSILLVVGSVAGAAARARARARTRPRRRPASPAGSPRPAASAPRAPAASGSSRPAASRTAWSWPASNQPPSSSAVASTRWSDGAARATSSWASCSRSGSVIAAIAASSSASV